MHKHKEVCGTAYLEQAGGCNNLCETHDDENLDKGSHANACKLGVNKHACGILCTCALYFT